MTPSNDEMMLSDNFTKYEGSNNSIEQARKCSFTDLHNSWSVDSLKDNSNEDLDFKVAPKTKHMVNEINMSVDTNKSHSFTRTETFMPENMNYTFINCEHKETETMFDDNSKGGLGNKRCRKSSVSEDSVESQMLKKLKCSTAYSKIEVLTNDTEMKTSSSSRELTSGSETSFKSFSSNASFKVRKRRHKSDNNLFRDVLQRTRGSMNISKSLPHSPGKIVQIFTGIILI